MMINIHWFMENIGENGFGLEEETVNKNYFEGKYSITN